MLFSSLLLSHLSPLLPDGCPKISRGFPLLYTPPRSFYSLVSAKATRRISHVGESARRRRRAARRKRAQARPARTDPPHGVGFVGGVGFVDVSFPPSLLIRHPCDIFLLFCEGLVFGFGLGGVWGVVSCVCFVCVGRGCERFGGCPPPAIYLGTIVLPLFRANGKGSGIRGRPHRLSRSTMATSIGRVTMRWPMAWALRWSLPPSLPSTRCKSTRATPRDGSRLLSAERWGDECPL